MSAWLNIRTLMGLMLGVTFGAAMSFMLGVAAGAPMGIGLGVLWAVVFNLSRTAGGPRAETETGEDAD